MIAESRAWVSGRGKYLLALPAGSAVVSVLALSGNAHEVKAGAPFLLLIAYACVVAMLGHTRAEIDERGFRLTPGPLPAFVRTEEHPREAVKHLFPRHIRENVAKNVWEDRYYATVELHSGRWLNVRGHYTDWACASQSCLELAKLWQIATVGAGRSGFPAQRDWTAVETVLLWGGAFITALLWGVYVEFTRGR